MRLLTILAGYAASSVAAMVVLVLFGWIDAGSLSLERIGYIVPLFLKGAGTGALMCLPIALPTIAFTELTRFHSVWIFACAGIATGVLILATLGTFAFTELIELRAFAVRDVIVVIAVALTASLTYWLIAWKLFAPNKASTNNTQTR